MKRQNGDRIHPRREFITAATGFGFALLSGSGEVKAQTRLSDKEIKPGTYDWSLEHSGLTRAYRIHIPPSYRSTKHASLVLAFHGGGGRGQGAEKLSGLTEVSNRHGFIVVYPDGVGRTWNDGRGLQTFQAQREKVDDVSFTAALIDELAQRLSIDRGSVYATGISNGGHMVNRLGVELSEKIAAIAPVAATMAISIAESSRPEKPVAVIDFHGTKDEHNYWEGGGRAGGKTLSVPALIQYVTAALGHPKQNPCPTRKTMAQGLSEKATALARMGQR
jgi:polyhydroxybutyrate depolymerase